MIEASRLTRRFGEVAAVDDVSFAIERGEVCGFLGPNGAGKTTTLRMLSGYLPPTSGSARVAGFDVSRDSLEVRRRIGYLPESVPLYREMRVREMLWFQARLHRMPRAEARRRVPAVLERVGVLERERAIVGQLSRGLRQRVGLALALLPDPEVLILDEPTSGLDPLQRIEVRKLVGELAADHTVIFSSHILSEVEAVARRVIVIHRGRIAADGTQAELVAALAPPSYVRVEAFVGQDAAKARELLAQLPGAREVRDGGRQGIHHAFDVVCDGDLREDVGALARLKGWALRELSWRRPTLEELFARIALGFEAAAPVPSTETAAVRASAPADVARAPLSAGLTVLAGPAVAPTAPAAPAPAAAAPPASRAIYSLNPFDRGATRDLSRPGPAEAPRPADGAGPPPDACP